MFIYLFSTFSLEKDSYLDLPYCLTELRCIAPEWLTKYGLFIMKVAASDRCFRRVLRKLRQIAGRFLRFTGILQVSVN